MIIKILEVVIIENVWSDVYSRYMWITIQSTHRSTLWII